MKNLFAFCAATLALATPGIAQAANYGTAGTYTFAGSVQVKKNLSSWSTCNLTVTVVVPTGGASATASASIGGSTPCPAVSFSGAPYTVIASGSPVTALTLLGVQTNIAPVLIFPADACLGNLTALWGGNTPNPRTITLADPTSDTADTNPDNFGATENPCKIKGQITQTSGPTQLTITP